MPKTAVVNPRRRRRSTSKRRRRNPSNAIKAYGSKANPRRRRRRRNPETKEAIRRVYATRGYRAKNPGLGIEEAFDIMPAATAGSLLARWGVKVAGPMTDGKPGIAHGVAGYLISRYGADLVGNVLGGGQKAKYAQIGSLTFLGDLFARTYFLNQAQWAQDLMYLGEGDELEVDDLEDFDLELDGFTEESALGADAGGEYVDEQGRRWTVVNGQWTLLSGGYIPQPDPAMVSGFTETSPLGRRSSFGYA